MIFEWGFGSGANKTTTRGLGRVLVFLIWLVGMALLERSKAVTEYFLFNSE
jgi:hypothetical protein